MIANKEMSFKEKLDGILEYKLLLESFAPPLINQELGREKMNELFEKWKKEVEATPSDASVETKYEIAYRNFLQSWITANRFMTDNKGDDGTNKFMRAAIKAWKDKHSNSALMLKFIGSISKKSSFQTLTKQLAYDLQIFSPFIVEEMKEDRMVLKVPKCKVVDVRKRNDFCLMACQNIIPAWLEEQFKIKMVLSPQGTSCSAIFTPF